MLITTRLSEKQITVTMDGPLDTTGMSLALDDIIEKTQGMSRGQAQFTITEFHWPSAVTILMELVNLPALVTLVNRLDKCAVMCDMDWVEQMEKVDNNIIPSLTLKAFRSHEQDAAQAWLIS